MRRSGMLAMLIAIVLIAFIPITTAMVFDVQPKAEIILQQDESQVTQFTVNTENVFTEQLVFTREIEFCSNAFVKIEQAYLRTADKYDLYYRQKHRADQYLKSKDYNNKTIAFAWPQTYARRL